MQPLPRHDEQHRPIPEIHAVRDTAPLGQRRQLQEPDHQRARRYRAAEHDGAGEETGNEESPAKGEGRRLVRHGPQRSRTCNAGDREDRGKPGEPTPRLAPGHNVNPMAMAAPTRRAWARVSVP